MDRTALLAKTVLFDGFSPADLEPLVAVLRPRAFPAGAYIFHEGDAANALFIIESGQVKIARVGRGGYEAVFVVLLPGEIFGELALFDERRERSADAQAVESTVCLALRREPLMAFLDAHPELLHRVIRILYGYIRQMDETFAEAAFLDIPGRLARKLLELAQAHGEQTDAGIKIGMRLTQRTLAGMVASSRENVNRALARLVSRGYIDQENGFITVARPAELRRMVRR